MEVRAQIGREAVDITAELEQGVLGRSARECPDGDPDRLRLGPPALAGPGVEPLEILLVEVHLQRPGHDHIGYTIMKSMSIRS